MKIGMDFDNTIVCYNEVFYDVARKLDLIPLVFRGSKTDLRNHICRKHDNDTWTKLQGIVYGTEICRAKPFPGIHKFLSRCREEMMQIFIVSHKTRHPIIGDPIDLHKEAYCWLEKNGLFKLISRNNVSFHEDRTGKIGKISSLKLTHFIDDLPEVFTDPLFPAGAVRILFLPEGRPPIESGACTAGSWFEVEQMVFGKS